MLREEVDNVLRVPLPGLRRRYTEQLKKMKPGPAKQTVQKRAMVILKQKKMYESQKEQTLNQQFNMDQVMFAQVTTTLRAKKRFALAARSFSSWCGPS